MMKPAFLFLLLLALAVALGGPLNAQNSPGAIFTTVPDGSEVNYNIYPSKDQVWLDGGPGPGAPQAAAGLSDGTYVFMVTDPSGKTLLSNDPVGCRKFIVSGGIITGVPTTGPFAGCQHDTNTDTDHGINGAKTVKLCDPTGTVAGCGTVAGVVGFLDTPNRGNEYKAWVEDIHCYLNAGCSLGNVDCAAGRHGFIRGCYTKSDNFKVTGAAIEIDTRFFADTNHNGFMDSDESFIDGIGIVWYDTLGNSNNKYSYLNTALDINHEAHVETPEPGTHQIQIYSQPGCPNIGNVFLNGQLLKQQGPQTVSVKVSPNFLGTLRVDVACE